MPQPDDHDELAALDFYSTDDSDSGEYSSAESDALDFSVAADGEEPAADALDAYAPPAQPEDTGHELDAIDSQPRATEEEEAEEEREAVQLFTVANPPDTVSVSAAIDGRTERVDLSVKVTSMSESELAGEILVLADLARQKGLAGQHSYLLENDFLAGTMRAMGIDGNNNEILRDFMESGLGMPTPEQAEAAQAGVFATRYRADK